MFYPTYAWIYFNWFVDDWWLAEENSCTMNGSVKAQDLVEKVLKNSLVVDHYPRIEDEDRDKQNVGNIVSNFDIILTYSYNHYFLGF